MSKTKKQQEDILIDFTNSNSAEQVTGSCIYIESSKSKILLECGLSQGKSMLENYRANSHKFNFKPKELDYVFLMHSHIDHIGLTPRLYKEGCTAKIFVPRDNKEFIRALLTNSAMIIDGETKLLSKKNTSGKEIESLYTQEDVDLMMKFVKEIDFYKEIEIGDIKFKFISSGHVTSAGSLFLEIEKGQTYKKIYYTSDLGNSMFKSYYTQNMDKIKNCDVVISECTYSTKEQSCSNKEHREKDIEKIKSTIEHYDKVLIPTFAFARTETILTLLYEIFKDRNLDRMIYLDSILLNDIIAIYRRMFSEFDTIMNWDKVKQIKKEDREALMLSNEKMIILSASGFLTGGASVVWTQSIIEKPNNCILFCGYTGEGTLASKIKDIKQKTVTIGGKPYKNKAQITSLRSFSSHIQYKDLLKYLSDINAEKVILHHGNPNGVFSFKLDLEEEFSKQCKTTKVTVPNKSSKIRI